MKTHSIILVLLLTFFVNSCSGEQTKTSRTTFAPTEFAEKIRSLPSVDLIDVRTPEEYSGGHLQNAFNIDWNSETFDQKIAELDKSKPIMVYCRSGSRSASAASRMRSSGFKEVYELQGGIMKWTASGLPVTTAPTAPRPPSKIR